MLIRGGCHCGNIAFELEWMHDPVAIAARVCTCSFCVKHGGVWTSSPDCVLRARIKERALVFPYAFGTKTAVFHICTHCGVVPFATSEIDARLYAVVSVNACDNIDRARLQQGSVSFDGEDTESRLARRTRNWIRDVSIQ